MRKLGHRRIRYLRSAHSFIYADSPADHAHSWQAQMFQRTERVGEDQSPTENHKKLRVGKWWYPWLVISHSPRKKSWDWSSFTLRSFAILPLPPVKREEVQNGKASLNTKVTFISGDRCFRPKSQETCCPPWCDGQRDRDTHPLWSQTPEASYGYGSKLKRW